jgi:poly-D-alanine transfer protein DltD
MEDFLIELVIIFFTVGAWLLKQMVAKKTKPEDIFGDFEEIQDDSFKSDVFTNVNNKEFNLNTKVNNESLANRAKVVDNCEKQSVAVESPVSADNELLDDFDLKKAVIYSEILKPKYEDF